MFANNTAAVVHPDQLPDLNSFYYRQESSVISLYVKEKSCLWTQAFSVSEFWSWWQSKYRLLIHTQLYWYIHTLHTWMQITFMLTFSVNVNPGRQCLSGTVDEGLASVLAWEFHLQCVDLKDTASHKHPVLQTLAQSRTLGLDWTWNFLQGVVVVVPAHWQFVVRNYWTTC